MNSEVGLVDERNEVVAVMSVDEIYERDFEREARLVYGTIDTRHPKVTELRKGGERSVPPRGAGWVPGFSIAIADC